VTAPPATTETAPAAAEPPPGRRASTLRPAFLVLAAVAAAFFVREAQEVFIPIVLAGLLAVAFEPVVKRLERSRVRRGLGAALALGALLVAGVGVLVSLNDEAVAALEELPAAANRLREVIRSVREQPAGTIEKVRDAAAGIEAAATAALVDPEADDGVVRVRIEEPPFRLAGLLVWGSLGLAAIAAQGVMIVLLAYFLLVDADRLRLRLVRAAGPAFSRRRITAKVLADIGDQLQRFLRALALSSSVVAVATWAALAALGVERAAFWGVAAGVLNTVPYFGAMLASAGIAAVTWTQSGSVSLALLAGGVALVITFLESSLLTPRLMGRAAGMSQAAIFVGLLLWSWLWGFWGVLLATPMMMALKATAEHVEGWTAVAELLSD
jgi:predicted PurR-regulated permease PerM